MSRSEYSDDFDDQLAYGRYRQAVNMALHGKRGQAMLRDLAAALDAMADKRLYSGSFVTPEGEFCALGALAHQRGIQVDDLGDSDGCSPKKVAERFGIAKAMAAEIMFINDEAEMAQPTMRYGQEAKERWRVVRRWVDEMLGLTP